MSKIKWDKPGEHFYENGVSNGVLYVMDPVTQKYGKGVAWNGLTSVSESPEGGELSAIYADNIKYLNLRSAEDFKATIECYTYPDEFAECNGEVAVKGGFLISQQNRKTFAFCYQTKVGNDLNPDLGYKIHIVYGATCSPSERSHETINDSPEAMTMSFEVDTVPVTVTGFKPTAHIVIDSRAFGDGEGKIKPSVLTSIENALYGTDNEPAKEPTLLLPDEIAALYTEV